MPFPLGNHKTKVSYNTKDKLESKKPTKLLIKKIERDNTGILDAILDSATTLPQRHENSNSVSLNLGLDGSPHSVYSSL